MKRLIVLMMAVGMVLAGATEAKAQRKFYSLRVRNADGQMVSMKQYQGKVLLIVNTATHCGFTPQYEALERLYEDCRELGFEVLDFPCNQFGGQAPESIGEIRSFCSAQFNAQFPLFDKIEVNGPNADPLFTYLKKQQPFQGFGPGSTADFMHQMLSKQDPEYMNKPDIKWNFTKFLVDRYGRVVRRFEPTASAEDVEKAVKGLLNTQLRK